MTNPTVLTHYFLVNNMFVYGMKVIIDEPVAPVFGP